MLTFRLHNSSVRCLDTSGEEPGRLLSDFLASRDLPLNTRCNKRGLCRGCEVDWLSAPEGESVRLKACQNPLSRFMAASHEFSVPHASLQDGSLYGISQFEIRVEGPATSPASGLGKGLALDIGTTTVAAALWDLENGRCLAAASQSNAQRAVGDNLIARIDYALQSPGQAEKLSGLLLEGTLPSLIGDICHQAEAVPGDITAATATGNPTMLHTLARASLRGLATYPFSPAFLDFRDVTTVEHGLGFSVPLQLVAGLGPFVGSDIVAGALASGFLDPAITPHPALFIDFGTNGEILLKHADGFLATATAAGPAFEGGRLNCGMTARPGAIAGLELAASGSAPWRPRFVPGPAGTAPERRAGLTGAACIDFLALAHERGWINAFGRIQEAAPQMRVEPDSGGDPEKRIYLAPETFLSEADLAELLQAKAAIEAGYKTLLELAGIEEQDLRSVLVAGGFGYFLTPAHARAIGLLPRVPLERIELVGNASLAGASLLLHASYRQALHPLLSQTRVIELNQISSFEDHFIDATSLG